ncbi:MAG: WecB/TagA/CpsF family glycosyltransferase [Thermoguttaceae bacterium]|jgi:N-acetylglucosaminyldiphosphoundecaprenol N-acetyl-beta-D-mannosaminyltransferase
MSTRHDVQPSPLQKSQGQQFSILGVRILNVTKQRAVELLENLIRNRDDRARSVFFVNAHTLNLAASDPHYRAILNSGDLVFGDGTGVRWAAKLQGIRLLDNLQGTDFTPLLLQSTADRGYSYFMLGGNEQTIKPAAEYAQKTFPGWILSGFHHGYLKTMEMSLSVIETINAARPDLLLVGMGNPIQERWICQFQSRIEVPVCIGIGGLFDFWAGNVNRAPQWLRGLGHEWIWRLYQQPRDKMRRYLVGNPLFLARIIREHLSKPKTCKFE